jgi:hypothetical protein
MRIPALVLEWLRYEARHYRSAIGDPGIPAKTQQEATIRAEVYDEILQKLKELS